MTRCSTAVWLLLLAPLVACAETPVVRQGAEQQRLVSRTFEVPHAPLRAKVIEAFEARRRTLAPPFDALTVRELKPPAYSPDWAMTFVDPGAFLDPYKKLPAEQRADDLLIDESLPDTYWESEYVAASAPAKFRCGFIVHFGVASTATRVDVYELVPTVWAGEHWAVTRHGVGFGRYHDIRFVEPTVKERVALIDLIGRLVAGSG